MWARKRVSLNTCPRSFITAASEAWLYEFRVRKALGQAPAPDLSAKDAEALLVLEEELASERDDG